MTNLGTSTVSHTGRRVVSALAGLALAATITRIGLARKQQRLARRAPADDVAKDPDAR